jgi:nucleotide-binding universal stress UspA family protein
VHLVHVIPDYVPMSPMIPLLPGDLRDQGSKVLAQAVQAAEQAAPHTVVTSGLHVGSPVAALVNASETADLMILGHETTRALDRVFTAAVTMGVAAKAHCPVVSVPDGWTEPTNARASIVVGFKTADHDTALLQHAFDTAAELDARLTIVHAWELPGCYDDIIVRRTHDTDWNLAALERIDDQIGDLRAAHPAIEVDVRVRHQQPAQALRDMSRGADLLMLARRGEGLALLHLGSTARALLREAACPVEILPHAGAGTEDQTLELERAGAPLK